MTKRISIGIAGAGIGGLTAAALLADRGHSVEVFDQFDTPQPVGSGLVIQPVGQAVLDHIGAGDSARAFGNPIQRMLGHEADNNRKVLNVWYDKIADGQYGLAIHRASLFEAIYRAVQARDVVVHTQSRIAAASAAWFTSTMGRRMAPMT
ncbi:NAD(P)-binding protein [Yoonia sp. GPGPB17]|uniref:FAD-dependent oxidoreductase n=1 Tax=Yoonia sp. GPGPB17 TaxID=3026147 RepID=UPI0030C41110